MVREDKYVYKLAVLAFFLLFIPVPFLRLFDDEVIFWDVARSFKHGVIAPTAVAWAPFGGHPPLAYLINTVFMFISEDLLVSRFVTVAFTLGSTFLMFYLVKSLYDEDSAFASSLLFLFSFQTLRFGTRFTLDAYGTFFFLLSLYFIVRGRPSAAGLTYALAMLSREVWIGLCPFVLIYLWQKKAELKKIVFYSLLPFVPVLLFLSLSSGLGYYFQYATVKGTPLFFLSLITNNLPQFIAKTSRGWMEFAVIQFITLAGFLAVIYWKREHTDLLILILPQFLIVSFTGGFLLAGGLTQYPMGLQASLAVLAGPGLYTLWEKITHKIPRLRLEDFTNALLLILVLQFAFFNYLATAWSLRGAMGVHDFGYWQDLNTIALLEDGARGEVISGVHGAFVEDAQKWMWTERSVSLALEYEPDWYINTPYAVKFIREPSEVPEVEVYYIGSYVIFHSHPRGHLHELIEPAEFKKWKYGE